MFREHHYCKGSASTKKEAKRAASLSLLEKIKTNKPPSSLSYSKNSLCCENTESDSCQNVKNAITTLHETCASFRWPHPTYEVLNEDGPSNSKVFTIGCSVVGYTPVVQGMGHTKSEAKHAASQALLEKIKKEDFTSDSRSKTCICGEKKQLTASDSKLLQWHPITLLSHICTENRFPPPVYEIIDDDDSAEKKLFCCEVNALQDYATGTGVTKREAKRAATLALLRKLKNTSYLEEYPYFALTWASVSDGDKELPYTSGSGDSVNPVSELYNYCSSQKWPLPVYALLSAEGPLHNQTFTVGCRILGQPEIGKGSASTEKEAKRAASLSLLEKIKTNKPPSSLSYSKNSLCCENTESDSCQNVKNAITTLHETCASFRWPHPTYEVLNEDGPSNSKVFTIGCSVVGYTPVVQGMGHTKSEAKHAASQALLEKIKKEDFTSDSRSKTCICGENEKLTLSETKDPTSTLHELCASRSWPYPDYELLSEVGPANYKVFTIGCVVRGYSEIGKGSGQSKTAAKHEASRAVLNQLKTASLLEDSSMNNSPLSMKTRKEFIEKEYEDPISVLHELCASRNWEYPTYYVTSEEGPSHQRFYTLSCSVFHCTSSGSGRRKKEAKRAASLSMLNLLKSEVLCPSINVTLSTSL